MIVTTHRAAAYCRYSSDHQRSESISAQLHGIQEYAKRKGILLVETYIDEAKSAMTDKRPAFQQMIADSSKKTFDTVIVHKLDRFARNRYDSAFYRRELKKNGVNLYSVLEDLNDSPESIILESVLEGMSEFYSSNLKRETMKGLLENARTCSHTGGQAPLGFDIDETTRKLIVNPEEAETVKLIFNMYANGSGYGEIIKILHKEGRKTKRGKEFAKNSLHEILKNQKYRGTYVFNKSASKNADGTRNSHKHKDESEQIIIEDGCPRIIEEEIFQTVQKRMQSNQKRAGRYNAKHNYLLSGKVYCKECGKAMVGNARKGGRKGETYITYRCPSGKHTCNNREINRDYIEKAVTDILKDQIFNPKALERIAQRIRVRAEVPDNSKEELEQQLREIRAGLKNVADAVEAGLLSEALIARLQKLEKEKVEIEAALAKQVVPQEINIDPQIMMQQYEQVEDKPESKEYKELVQSYIDKVLIGRYNVEIHLKTGLDLFPDLNSVVSLRRQAIYLEKGAV